MIAETGGGGATGATGTLREYIWLPETMIAPTAGSSAAIDRPLAVVEDVETASPQLWYVHVDHLNRPVRMTDGVKATVWTASWQPWGGVHAITGTAALNLRFPGQWFQLEAGLHYNWHRHYDPSLGRYTQPDPLGFVDGPSVYGYAGGSPQVYVDPDGESFRLLVKLWEILKKVKIEGPGKDCVLHGHGRIMQIRYGEWFCRLDFDPIKRNLPPSYHLNIGSSKKGRTNYHIPLYTPTTKIPPP